MRFRTVPSLLLCCRTNVAAGEGSEHQTGGNSVSLGMVSRKGETAAKIRDLFGTMVRVELRFDTGFRWGGGNVAIPGNQLGPVLLKGTPSKTLENGMTLYGKSVKDVFPDGS